VGFDRRPSYFIPFRVMKGLLLGACFCLVFLPGAVRAEDNDLLAPLTPPKGATKSAPAAVKRKPPVTARKGKLVVHAPGVPDAVVFVDDEEIGNILGDAINVPVGTHQVVVKRAGYVDFTRTLNIRPGKVTELSAQLDPSGGTLGIDTSPEGAQVLVDGQPMGTTPMRNIVLPPGTYELKVHKEGYRDELARVSIRMGKQQSLRLSLKALQEEPVATRESSLRPITPRYSGTTPTSNYAPSATVESSVDSPKQWYQRWYVWAGAAAVVAAGVTTAVMVSSNGRPSLDTVCGGAARCGTF
jgi:hypothetical protein